MSMQKASLLKGSCWNGLNHYCVTGSFCSSTCAWLLSLAFSTDLGSFGQRLFICSVFVQRISVLI